MKKIFKLAVFIGVYLGIICSTSYAVPTLASSAAWYQGEIDRATITKITFTDEYTVTNNEDASWNAGLDESSQIMCYITGTELTIVGDGSGSIMGYEEQVACFEGFSSLGVIENLDMLDLSQTTDISRMFYNCKSLETLDLSNINTKHMTNLTDMFYGMTALTEITLGENFDFKGNGTDIQCNLPTPSSEYIEGADGNWYTSETGYTAVQIAESHNSLTTYSAIPTVTSNDTTYTITYDSNGGEGAPESQTKTQGYGLVLSSVVPTRDGYQFLGWAVASDATEAEYEAGATFNIDEDITLYAVWQQQNNLCLCAGCVNVVDNIGEICTTCMENQTCDVCNNCITHCTCEAQYECICEGCSNQGDVENTKCEACSSSVECSLCGNCEMHCVCETESTYTISYDANGGEGAPLSQTKTEGEDLTITDVIPEKDGYVFVGWNTEQDGTGDTYNAEDIYSEEDDITLYAMWVDEYTLAKGADWYKGSVDKSEILDIRFYIDYEPQETDKAWNADIGNRGTVKCYITDSKYLIFSVSAEECVKANKDSSYMFSGFSNVQNIYCYYHDGYSEPYSVFDMSGIEDMSYMFNGCGELLGIELFEFSNIEKVTNMSNMFSGCSNLQYLYLGNFDTSNVTDMSNMFYNCSSLQELDLSNFDTANVDDMRNMFSGLNNLYKLKIGNDFVFADNCVLPAPSSEYIEQADGNWYTEDGTPYTPEEIIADGLNGTFYAFHKSFLTLKEGATWYTEGTTIDKSEIANIEIINYYNIEVPESALASWKADITGSGLITCYISESKTLNMFVPEGKEIKLSQNASGMFSGFTNIMYINGLDALDTSDVTDMSSMFANCSKLNSIGLYEFDTSKVTNMSGMFSGCESLTYIDAMWCDTSSVENMSNMFYGCSNIAKLVLTNFDTSNVTNMSNMFANCTLLESLNLSNFDTSKVTNMSGMFEDMNNLTAIVLGENFEFKSSDSALPASSIEGANGNWFDKDENEYIPSNMVTEHNTHRIYYATKAMALTPPTLTQYLFDDYYRHYGGPYREEIKEVTFKKSYEPTGQESYSWPADNYGVGSVMCYAVNNELIIAGNGNDIIYANEISSYLFDFYSLEVINNLDILDTSKVKDMSNMFAYCNLNTIDLSSLDTSNVTNMSYMFAYCNINTINLNSFNTSNVTDMSYMFQGSKFISLDLTSFDTSNVTSMGGMFSNCSNLESINLSSFNTSSVTNMYEMFNECNSLQEIDLNNFNTSNVTSMGSMFSNCSSLQELNISSFNTNKTSYMTNMFNGMDKLSQITVGANFSFKGSGTSVKCKLPIPTSTDEDKWYIANGTVYTTTQIASKKAAATYYAVDPSMKITAPSSITGGRISPSGTVSVEEGTNKIFTISPTSGYHIKTITVDGTNIEITNKSSMQYTFSNVTENHTISAIFEKCAGGTATCSSKATCTTCSSEYGTMLGHNYTEATCEEAKTCSVCGATEGEALGHNYTEATCTEAKTCSVCGATEGEALGHTYEVVQEADCEKEEIKECTRCQDRKTTKDSLGHTIVYRFDDTYHWQGCEVCAFESEEKLPHTGGIATSTTKAICETCSTPYGGFVYTVTYNANGGTGSMTSQTFAEGTAQSLTANSFSRSGYTFLGWSTTKTGSVEFSNGANYTATADITLYAIWQKNSSGGGGSGGGGSSSSKPSKEEVTKPEETQKPQDEEKVEEKEEILEEEILEEELPKEEKDIILIIGKANDYNEILLSLKDLLEIYGLDGEIKCTKTKATYSSKDQTIEFEDGKLNITVNNIADVLARPVKIINKKVYITLTDFLDLM